MEHSRKYSSKGPSGKGGMGICKRMAFSCEGGTQKGRELMCKREMG
jgi:hypothetical protein